MRTSSDSVEVPETVEGLEVSGLYSGYGGEPVVRDVSLLVRAGKIVSVVGPNGAGKSTLLKAIVGITVTTQGKVSLWGEEVTNLATDALVRKGVAYVPQIEDVFAPMTVEDNLQLGGYLLDKRELRAAIERVVGLFPALGILRRRVAGSLSGGERKMLALGRALMVEPRLVILDEPTANLAPELARVVLSEHVPKLAERGAAVLLVEQRAVPALKVSDWAYVMSAGRPTANGPGKELAIGDKLEALFFGRNPGSSEEVGRGAVVGDGR